MLLSTGATLQLQSAVPKIDHPQEKAKLVPYQNLFRFELEFRKLFQLAPEDWLTLADRDPIRSWRLQQHIYLGCGFVFLYVLVFTDDPCSLLADLTSLTSVTDASESLSYPLSVDPPTTLCSPSENGSMLRLMEFRADCRSPAKPVTCLVAASAALFRSSRSIFDVMV